MSPSQPEPTAILTADMKRVVGEQRLGFVATVCSNGTPNLSPKGTIRVWDDEHLAFCDLMSPQTVEKPPHESCCGGERRRSDCPERISIQGIGTGPPRRCALRADSGVLSERGTANEGRPREDPPYRSREDRKGSSALFTRLRFRTRRG
jgi:hypothetical protein